MIQFKRGTTSPIPDTVFESVIDKALKQLLIDKGVPGISHNTPIDIIADYDKLLQVRDYLREANLEQNLFSDYEQTWSNIILANGQPGYDKRTHKLKIGDGQHSWTLLPTVGGLDYEQVLSSERMARYRQLLNPDDKTIFTYGVEPPDKNTVGQVYLHQYDGDIETDYVIETGVDGAWTYRKWNSGLAECWCTAKYDNVEIMNEVGSLFSSPLLSEIEYPQKILFAEIPTEINTATLLTAKEDVDNPEGAEGENTPSDAPVDSIIFLTTGKTIGKDTEPIINTKKVSSRVYITSPIKLIADIQLNIMVYGRFEKN